MKPVRIRPLIGIAAVLALTAGACAGVSAAEKAPAAKADHFKSGLDRYQSGAYPEAAREFAQLAASGFESAAVYYNLGNSWVKAGEVGKAAWAYERAHLLDPRDEDIRFNRALLRTALGDAPRQDVDVLDPVRELLEKVRTSEIELALQIVTVLLTLWMLGFAYARPLRALFGTLFWLTLVVSSAVGLAAWIRWSDVRYPAAVVQEKEVFVRYGPGVTNSRAYPLKQGALLRIEKRSGDWYLVRLTSGQAGWIPTAAVLKVEP